MKVLISKLMSSEDPTVETITPQQTPADGRETDYEQLVQSASTHAIFLLGPEGHIESWTDAASRIYGYEADAILDCHLNRLAADTETDHETVDLGSVLTEARETTVEVEQWQQRADGSVFWATMTLSPAFEDGFQGYAVVSQDTTAHKQYVRMLERQNDRLKEFTDILSHDLKNPLNVLDGRIELYQQTGDPEHVKKVKQTIDRMDRLVEDLLRIARQGRVVRDPGKIDLSEVIETAREGTLPRTATLDYDPVPKLMGDDDRLCQMFENLFRNATEHGGKSVTVRVAPREDGTGFYVADDGPGIPDEIKSEVFDHGFSTESNDSGFGLSIVRTIIEAHGWDISVTDAAGGGARFDITNTEFVG